MSAKTPPAPSAEAQLEQAQSQSKVNQIYWGVLSGTVLTWILAVVAAVDGGWMTIAGVKALSLKTDAFACALGGAWGFLDDSLEETMDGACSIVKGARACQIMATLLISCTLVLVVFAAFQPAPATGKYGAIAGISLLVFSVLQLITFCLMAAYIKKYESIYGDVGGGFYNNYLDVKPGPTFGVAVVAFILGFFGAVVTLALYKKAAYRDGPLRKFNSAANAGTANAAPAAPPAVGTV